MGNLGVSEDVISRVLGHRKQGVTGRVYDHAKRNKEAKAAWQKWADHLDALAEPNVVAMERDEFARWQNEDGRKER